MPTASPPPLTDDQIAELDALLAAVPAPLEPLDAAMADGFLCGVLVQPRPVPASRWLPHVTDAAGRPLPKGFDAARLHALLRRRHAELDDAIGHRRWFDPWVFDAAAGVAAVEPWVAGFASAMEWFPELLDGDSPALTHPLALIFRHLDADELEDADALLEEIESLEPPADLPAAVEEIVRATLLLADIGRPLRKAAPRRRSDR
jgi:uncharacterized protein